MLGIAIGLLMHAELLRYFAAIVIVGLALHGVGMYDKHRIEKSRAAQPAWWMQALYITCWIALAAFVGYVIVQAVNR